MQSCRQNKKGSRDKKTLSLEYLNLQAEACMPVTHASSWRGPRSPHGKGRAPPGKARVHSLRLIKILEQKALCQGSLAAHLLGKLFS